MHTARKIWNFLKSMNFAILLLTILAAACAFGSFITQNQSMEWYIQTYGEKTASAITLFGLDDVFHSPWFVILALFLCLNLFLCSVFRVPVVIRRWKQMENGQQIARRILQGAAGSAEAREESGTPEGCEKSESRQGEDLPEQEPVLSVPDIGQARKQFHDSGFRNVREGQTPDGVRFLYAYRNRIGLWGAWLCHVGILILILGFGLGQMTKKEYSVYGVPGQSRQVGDTSYILTIDDFKIELREDDTVSQYTADVTMRDAKSGQSRSGQIQVNAPQTMFGMKVYQNSTGWAATVTVLKDGEKIQKAVLCAGEYLEVEDKEGLVILFRAFYPDFYRAPDGSLQTRSGNPDNPGYLYQAYYQGNVIGMNVLTGEDVITIDEYTVIFSDPQPYTLIQIKQDRFTVIALLGGLTVIVALLLAFYLRPAQMCAAEKEDGTWLIGSMER